MTDVAATLRAIPGRAACTDAERRAALAVRDALRAQGRPARLETVWVRPGWPLPYAILCTAGVAASLIAKTAPIPALVVLGLAFLLIAGDASGRAPILRALLPRRATQNVVSEPVVVPPGARVRLIVTAAVDAPRRGLAASAAPLGRRLRAALGGRTPTAVGLLALSFLALTALAAARVAGSDADWLAPVAVLPTVVLVVGTFAFADLAFATPAPDDAASATSVATALALVAALDRRPPRHLAIECVIAGASGGGELGFDAYVDARRRGARPEELAVLALGTTPALATTPAHHPKEGRVLGVRLHPQLVAHAREAGLPAVRGRTTGALPARHAGWPALGLSPARGERQRAENVSESTMENALEVIRLLDSQFSA